MIFAWAIVYLYLGVNGCSIKWPNSVLNVKVVVAAFNQEKNLVGAFSVITHLRMELLEALQWTLNAGGESRIAVFPAFLHLRRPGRGALWQTW